MKRHFWRQALHLEPPAGWLNDPNGLAWFGGKYHVFFQYCPQSAQGRGPKCWGHYESPDLVNWTFTGAPLQPGGPCDRGDAYSGSAAEENGTLWLYYTGNYKASGQHDYILTGRDHNTLRVAFDGRACVGEKQLLLSNADYPEDCTLHVRDPKVWRAADGSFRMVLGSTREGVGQLLFYRSADGLTWTCAGRFGDPALGTTLECPDLFCLDGRWVLLGSPMGITADGLQYPDQSTWMPVDFDETTCHFALQGAPAMVDWGLDLYAPQTTLDEEGRRVLIGWMRMPRPVEDEPNGRAPWRGMMSLPRLVEWREGHLCFPIHPHVTACFTQPAEGLAPLAEHKPVRLQGTLRSGQTWNVGGYRLWMEDGCLCTDRSAVFDGLPGYRLTARTPALGQDACDLDIFVTDHLVEIFLDGGRYVLSHVLFGLDGTLEGDFNTVTTVRA